MAKLMLESLKQSKLCSENLSPNRNLGSCFNSIGLRESVLRESYNLLERRVPMKKATLIFVGAIGFGTGIAAYFLRKHLTIKDIPPQPTETLENRFQTQWTAILQTDAELYNGLYAGLERVSGRAAKKPEKILKEWYSRTVYQWEKEPIAALCKETLAPAVESADPDACAKWAELLLNAARAAGITKETAEELELDETTIRAYEEWDGNDLYVGDHVRILHPAWYQSGHVIEQGHCTRLTEESEEEVSND